METVVYILCMVFTIWTIYKIFRKNNANENSDFDFATVNEKFMMAKQTSDNLYSMEQLVTDLDLCSDENQIVIQISWIGEDDTAHTYDLYCDGMNTATECLRDIAQREAWELRQTLAYQCDVLARSTRHRKNCRKNDAEIMGEWLHDKAV